MTKKTAISTFIDGKYIPLENKYKLGAFVLLLVLPTLVFYLAIFQPGNKTIAKLKQQKTSLQAQVAKIESRAANRDKFLKELENTEQLFAKTSALLPKEKEIPNLLTSISALGRGVGLDFLSFKPNPSVPKDFYMEIPVSISLNGPYHNVGLFFDQVSKLNRIVSVTSIAMTNPTKEGTEMMLNSNCQLMTYRFTNTQLSKPKSGKKK